MVDPASAALGCRVAVDPLADTDAGTVFPPGSRSTKLVAVTLLPAIGSLKVALTLVPRLTFGALLAGVTLATVGGVVSVCVSVAFTYWRLTQAVYSAVLQSHWASKVA